MALIETVTNLDFLITPLRIHIGDLVPETYRYTDAMLRTTLVAAVKSLQLWWNYKYLVNYNTYEIERNPNIVYLFSDPPIIQDGDQTPIVLMASILIKTGQLENSSYSVGSWRDAEISYSNIESSRLKDRSLSIDMMMLEKFLQPPDKKLVWPQKNSLPGFKNNAYEHE